LSDFFFYIVTDLSFYALYLRCVFCTIKSTVLSFLKQLLIYCRKNSYMFRL